MDAKAVSRSRRRVSFTRSTPLHPLPGRPIFGSMDDQTLLRYSRQIMLPSVDAEGQQRLLESRVLIIGAGGLGSPVAMYLAAGGVGHLGIVDFDHVDLSNLQRQIIHASKDVGRLKVDSAAERIHDLNPQVQVTTFPKALEGDELLEAVDWADVVVECTDNFAARFTVNAACARRRTPLVSGAVIRMEGQVATFSHQGGGPCYRCLYRDESEPAETCTQSGVLAPVPGIVGSIQAVEAMKLLLGLETLQGRLLLIDALSMEFRTLSLKQDPACPVCSQPAAAAG